MRALAVHNPTPPPAPSKGRRPRIAFFDYADVFEDFYPHYGVDQQSFATTWAGSGNHTWVSLLQSEVGDVTWYETSLAPYIPPTRHLKTGAMVHFLRSSWLHRCLWTLFYVPRMAWRWRGAYRPFATAASYLAPFSPNLWRRLRRDRPDFIFVQSYSSGRFDVLLLMAKLLRVPLIAYHAGGEPDGYLGGLLRRWTVRRADLIVVSSMSEWRMLAKRYRVDSAKLRLILTPIETSVYAPVDRQIACSALTLDPRRRYLLFVGRLDDQVKRVSSIITTFAAIARAHSDADLLIAGDGQDHGALQELAQEVAPGRIRFLGWITEEQRKAYLYNCAECLILASRREGFPTVVGEAMACGTPVAATEVGGIPELVAEHSTGWLLPPADDEALKRAMCEILSDPKRVSKMRFRAREAALQRVAPDRVAAALRECFALRSPTHA